MVDRGDYYEIPHCRISIDLDGGSDESEEEVISSDTIVKVRKDVVFGTGYGFGQDLVTAEDLFNRYGHLFIPDHGPTIDTCAGRFDDSGYLVKGTSHAFG